jgi:hypothetical protein
LAANYLTAAAFLIIHDLAGDELGRSCSMYGEGEKYIQDFGAKT